MSKKSRFKTSKAAKRRKFLALKRKEIGKKFVDMHPEITQGFLNDAFNPKGVA